MTAEHTILLVEDDADDVLLIQRALRRARVTAPVLVLPDGEAATRYFDSAEHRIEPLRHPDPSLVLLDLKLPLRSGFEVLEKIRGQSRLGRTIVVVLTSSREHDDVRRAYALGANSYLVKPIDPAAMNSLIDALQLYWLRTNQPPVLPSDPHAHPGH